MRIVLCSLLLGCSAAGRSAEPAPAPAMTPEPVSSAPAEPAPGPASAAASDESASQLPAEGPSASTPRLPALSVQSIGMHVGGGANDPASKAPFLRALEARFPAFLECFRLAAEPGAGGTFGVDLRVAAAGGAPTVEQPRSSIAGEEFRSCMLSAFEGVLFEPTKKSLVLSYSLRFTLGQR
jgi:hypothetical protein